jgi:group II intron reverse transcriptase/maturase
MQTAQTRLSILKQKSEHDKNYKFERLYQNLYNQDFYLRAYQKLYAKEGNLSAGIDNVTIDGFSLQTTQKLISLLRTRHYKPKPSKRAYIPKKNGKLRPLGIPCFEDKLIQEILREILEAIYEPLFCETSHGFRPNRSCQTALHQIKNKSPGTNWVIEGDITRFFENIDHDILIELLAKKIKDGRVLELIRQFLKAGYFDLKEVHDSLSVTPQGSGLSPILANIYLNTFDQYIEELSKQYSKGDKRQINPQYQKLCGKRRIARKRGHKQEAKQILKQMLTMPSLKSMDESFIRVDYVRFADDFLVCIMGSRAMACEIKEKLSVFMAQNLKLELNQEKPAITNLSKERVRFLGFELTKS